MKNQEIAQAFERAADILALLDENTFRVLALRKVARTLDELPTPIEQLAAEGGLENVAGIGKSSADRIREFLRTGRIAEFDDIAAQVPAGVLEIMKIPTVGPKTAALLWKEGGIATVETLLKEIDLGEKSPLLKIKGLGAKKLAKMKENLAFLATTSGRIRIGEALPIALELSEFLRRLPGVQAVQYCGSLRRGKETIGDIDIAVAAPAANGAAIGQAVTAHPTCTSVIASGETKTSFRTAAGVQVDVRVVPPESFGAAIQYFTGSKEHNVRLRELAIKKGLKVNEWGVFQVEKKIQGDPQFLRMLEALPRTIPSGGSAGDAVHRQFRNEILLLLDCGFRDFLPEVRWFPLNHLDEDSIKAVETLLIHDLEPPLNRQKASVPFHVAQELISKVGGADLVSKIKSDSRWIRCDTDDARKGIVHSISHGETGVYLFKASNSGWTSNQVGYVGIAARGVKNSSDLRYRLNDHFRDDSAADDFADRFLQLYRSFTERLTQPSDEKIAGETEEGVYAALGLAWIPPEMREDRGELDWALARAKQNKTENLVSLSDIRGDLHMHTTASDGACSIEQMVAEAKRRGYQYIAITDHSKSQIQANGLKADRLLEHIQAIRAVAREAAKSGMLVLAGTEVDILADGSLDYEDDLLAQLDWVIASPHSALTQETEPATQRLVKAAANPHVCVLGHPTGRLIPSRRGLEPDMPKVVFAAARHGVALEISAHYFRLDLRDVHARLAVDAKVPLCINSDSHALPDFDMMQYGILTARRGWATPADILNAWPVDKFKKWLKERKELAAW